MRSLKFNLSDPSNPDLRRQVLRGEVTVEGSEFHSTHTALVDMSPESLASEEKKKELAALKEKGKFEALAPKPSE